MRLVLSSVVTKDAIAMPPPSGAGRRWETHSLPVLVGAAAGLSSTQAKVNEWRASAAQRRRADHLCQAPEI